MPVELANPWGLLLLLAIPPALWAARRSLAGLEGGRALVSTALRVSILLLLALAAAGPRLRLGSSDLSIVFLLDASASVASDARGEAIELVEQSAREASPRDRVGVVVFGGDASVERALREGGLGTRLDNLASVVRSDRTDIAGALRLAAGLVPDGTVGRLVLLSDGNENEGSAVEEARRLRPRGIQVYSVPLRSGGGPEVAVADLRLPDSPAAGESFDLRVEVTATRDTNARLRVFRNNAPVAERDVALAADGTNVFLLPQRLDAKGFYTYRAEVEAVAADGFAQNNGREAFTYVEGRPRTLYVYGDARPSAALADVLEAGRFDAEIVAARQFPVHLADLQNYDLIIFDNVSAETLAPSQLADIRAYVRDLGGGFVMIGGDKSFGAGGYYKTPVEETLPVSLDVRQKKRFPALALVLVVDKSGSMEGGGGESKMTLAKEGAVSAVDFLADTDAVGVVAFDDASKVVVPLGELAGEKEEVKNLIGTIVAGGGTTIYPALKTAHDALTLYEAPLKHIVLLSDGQSNEGDYAQLVGLLKAQKITLSTVAVGADADLRLMEYLAGATGGRFYISEDVGSLPRIFTKEAFLASRSTIVEEPTPALPAQPAQATSGIDWASAPPLGGYVGSAPRDLATTALVTHHDDPLYATWQFGLGRSAAFTSGTGRRWAAGWLGWGGFPTFWTQVFRETVRRASNERLQPAVMVEGGRGRVTVDAFTAAGGSANDVSLTGRVVAPDGSASDVVLRQTAPGRYEAEFEAAGEGAYLVSLVSSASQGGARVTGAVRGYSPEFEVRETDRDLLERVAAASGGSVVGEETRLFAERGWASRPRDVWQWCVLAALLLLPVDVGVRRVRLSRYELAEGAAWVRARVGLGARVAPASVEVASLESLKATKRRAVMTAEPAPRAPSEAGMGDDTRASPVPSAPPEAPRPGESPSAPPGAPSPDTRTAEDALSSRLLDARRRRRSSGDE